MAETASRGRLPWPGRPVIVRVPCSRPRSATHSSQVGRLGDQAGVPVDQTGLEQGPGAEPAAALLVGDQVEHHVAGPARPARSRADEGADGGRDAALHIGGAPPVQPAVLDAGIEGVVAPGFAPPPGPRRDAR